MRYYLPHEYFSLPAKEVLLRIQKHREKLGDDLLILAHHYQSDAVMALADKSGDSFELSRFAAAAKATRIIFAGVHFMAEAADIMTRDDQTVVLPHGDAGCPMADMAPIDEVEAAWRQLASIIDVEKDLMPVTYINSHATVKAFCGRHGGIICTSSSARAAVDWALERRSKLFFFPDQHLGRNTAIDRGIPEDKIVVWDPHVGLGGLTVKAVRDAQVILWKGNCHVHTRFKPEMVFEARALFPYCVVIVHSETPREVLELADAHGSTRTIVDYVNKAPPGATIFVGTEVNLVNRLAKQSSLKMVLPLAPSPCPNMHRNTINDILYVLDQWPNVNVVRVPPDVRDPARTAMERMLSLQV